jgi:type II secretory ATPase GspE/PulE/Tfp pilus assembly ATPase PilB-like protein
LESGPEICKLIAAGSPEPMIVEEAVRGGFRALVDDGISKLLDGTTTVAEIASAISLE